MNYEAEIVLPILEQPRIKSYTCPIDGYKYHRTETGWYCSHCGAIGWWNFTEPTFKVKCVND